MSNTTAFPEPKIGFHIFNINPTILPSSLCYFAPLCGGQSFPSTIFDIQIIGVKSQQIVCLSLPNGWGFLPTHIKLGEQLLHHLNFVQNIDPSSVELVLHILVPKFFHLSHFQKIYNCTVLLHCCVSKLQLYHRDYCGLYIHLIKKGINETYMLLY